MEMDEQRELEEMRRLLESTVVRMENIIGNGNNHTRVWITQSALTIVTALLIAGAFFLFGLPERITAVAEEKANLAIRHNNEVLEPRLRSIEENIAAIKVGLSDIRVSQESMGRSISALEGMSRQGKGDQSK